MAFGFLDRSNKQDNQNDNNNQNQNQNTNSSDSQDNNNSNTQDNKDDNNNNNVDNNTSIWDNNTSDSGNDNNNQNDQNNQNQNTNQNQQSPDEVFNKHVADLNLTNGVDLQKIEADMREGNTESLQAAFDTIAANTYKASLQQMNTLADNKIAAAMENAVSESTANMNSNLAVKELHTALPFVTDKNIAPVAEAALKQLMSKGASVEEAIKGVSDFFKATAEKVGGMSNAPDNFSNNNYNRNSNQQQDNNNSGKDDSWMEFLTQS